MKGKGPWIRMLRPGEEAEELLQTYDEYKVSAKDVDNILAIHSMDPPTLRPHLHLYRQLMYGPSALSRADREMLAVTVSVINECHY